MVNVQLPGSTLDYGQAAPLPTLWPGLYMVGLGCVLLTGVGCFLILAAVTASLGQGWETRPTAFEASIGPIISIVSIGFALASAGFGLWCFVIGFRLIRRAM